MRYNLGMVALILSACAPAPMKNGGFTLPIPEWTQGDWYGNFFIEGEPEIFRLTFGKTTIMHYRMGDIACDLELKPEIQFNKRRINREYLFFTHGKSKCLTADSNHFFIEKTTWNNVPRPVLLISIKGYTTGAERYNMNTSASHLMDASPSPLTIGNGASVFNFKYPVPSAGTGNPESKLKAQRWHCQASVTLRIPEGSLRIASFYSLGGFPLYLMKCLEGCGALAFKIMPHQGNPVTLDMHSYGFSTASIGTGTMANGNDLVLIRDIRPSGQPSTGSGAVVVVSKWTHDALSGRGDCRE